MTEKTSSAPVPSQSSSKRAASPSASASTIKRPRSHTGKVSTASATQHLSDAVLSAVDAFRSSDATTSTALQTSPQRHRMLAREAIKLLEDDDALSDHEFSKAVKLLGSNAAVANTFLSISKKERRTLFIQDEIYNA